MSELTHYSRFRGYDYSRGVALFITVTTAPRRQVFGRVIDAVMELSELGRECLASIEHVFSGGEFRLFGHVVMPDHVHFIIHLRAGFDNDEAIRRINRAVGRFKSWVNRCWWQHGGEGALWQQGFHDWICLGREVIEAVERYIAYNPLKWELRNNRHLLRMYEPLASRRLSPTEYWRGVGAVELLDEARQLVSLRVSRRCNERDVAALIARLTAKAAQLTIMSGFISGGERAVLGALLANPAAHLIKVSPYALAHDYQPGVSLMPAIGEGRLAIIAAGNSPEEISRPACLDLNDKIAAMADHAAYALPGEIKWLK